MKKFIAYLLLILFSVALLLSLGLFSIVQLGMISRSELAFMSNLAERDGPGAVIELLQGHVLGTESPFVTDPSYGRQQVEGRGNAPWVLRSNLDERPRILMFALAPHIWVAYDIQHQSLYQIWRGKVQFDGPAYNQQHGPQPHSEGAWYYRNEDHADWFIEVDGRKVPATIQYLGHEYGKDRKTAYMRFALSAEEYRLELTEQPEFTLRADGTPVFTRHFERLDNHQKITAGFSNSGNLYHVADGTLKMPLSEATPIRPPESAASLLKSADRDVAKQGEAIIAGSDCLGCHAEGHRVSGPAWARIAGKFRGKAQEEVVSALATRVIEGGKGIWGQVPMPSHPELSQGDAEAAITYILSVDATIAPQDSPLDAQGQAYTATPEYDYDILPKLTALHPSFRVEKVAPQGFEPRVGGMDLRSDGSLVVASWDLDGAVFLVDPGAPEEQRVRRIAEGLHEPLGLAVVDDRIFVLQKQELTELIDTDGDDVIDLYRAASYDWPTSSNFHSFAFGLVHQQDDFYFLLSICVLPGGASCPDQYPTQGKLLRVDKNGNAVVHAAGFRTPNGIALGAENSLYVTDNQGDWLPSSKFIEIEPGGFYGSRAVPDPGVISAQEIPPSVWLPQDEVGNSPTQPLQLAEGPYAGQWIFGDIYNGGIKRVFLEEVDNRQQGAAFHFSAGFEAGVNRLLQAPDGSILVGEAGSRPNWGEYGKAWQGLERMIWVADKAFEMRAVRARSDGFDIELTQPLADDIQLTLDDLLVKQWFYHPTEQYGGPKYDETTLPVEAIRLSGDRRHIELRIPGLQAGYVVYLRLADRLRSASGEKLWTAEAWYTLNNIPKTDTEAAAPMQPEPAWRDLFDGETLAGWRNYGGHESDVSKWRVIDGILVLEQNGIFPMWDLIKSAAFGGPSGDLIYYRESFRNFELSLEWKISAGGNSGIFYLVKDELENVPWHTGIEMQILDNELHSDGNIITHRAGDLYDLIAATPETAKPAGEWNKVRIRIKDNHIEHWLNAVKVVSIERTSKKWDALVAASKFADMPDFGKFAEGYIVLQDHGDLVSYRNIRIRRL